MNQQYPSRLLEKAVDEFAKLPGVGRKTALRLVLHMLRQDVSMVDAFAGAMTNLRHNVKYCRVCHNISDSEICPICSNPHRDASIVCVVENVQDVMAIENTQQYNGLYHVLNGVISPIEGKNPEDLNLYSLLNNRITKDVKEVIIALNPSIEGEVTSLYIQKVLEKYNVKVSRLSYGIPMGSDIEYLDPIMISKAWDDRKVISNEK